MGYFSDLAISMNEGHNLTERDTFVCGDCVVDEALQVLVDDNLESKNCSYCEAESSDLIAAPFDLVMERIFASISTKYADAQDLNMPWVEGGWLTGEIYTHDVVGDFDPGWDGKFLDDIIDSLDPMTYWAEHSKGDWAISDPSDTLLYGWDSFKNQVLTKTRFLFLTEPEDEFSSGRPDYIPISSMLDALGETCVREGLVNVIPAGTEFYRVRHASKKDNFNRFSEMGVPPVGVASAGRMNPPGISYLYLAFEKDTAEKEVLSWSKRWFTARFRSKVDISVVDFSVLPYIPSLFEPDRYDTRHNRYFLYAVRRDLTLPVAKDGKEHVDYVPTQIVSEFFRYRFRDGEGAGVLGIKYPSVKNEDGVNLAIFSSDNDELQETFELIDIEKC
jgi:hypothetical protein